MAKQSRQFPRAGRDSGRGAVPYATDRSRTRDPRGGRQSRDRRQRLPHRESDAKSDALAARRGAGAAVG
eukprot:8767-Eustigmatos_ZCMA.PRE.1